MQSIADDSTSAMVTAAPASRSVASRTALLEEEHPRFSDAEMRRRRDALVARCRAHDLDRLALYGANRAGTAVGWLTGWPVTREAAVVVEPDGPDTLLVQFRNHVPLAGELATAHSEVAWAGPATAETLVAELRSRGGPTQRVGVIGPLPASLHRRLAEVTSALVPIDRDYTALRLVKSAEELEWLRVDAWLSDLGIAGLRTGLREGLSERELVDLVERAYVPLGGATHICYVGTTSMHRPARAVPAQFPSARRVAAGDVVVVKLSSSFCGYAGQVLRTFAVAPALTPLYRELHAVGETALDAVLSTGREGATVAQLQAAASVTGEAGYRSCDDLVNGFGGGYLPPVIAAREHGVPLPETVLAAGMTIVVQPNVMTADGRAGVQTGELVLVTHDGFERLHETPRGAFTLADTPLSGPEAPARG